MGNCGSTNNKAKTNNNKPQENKNTNTKETTKKEDPTKQNPGITDNKSPNQPDNKSNNTNANNQPKNEVSNNAKEEGAKVIANVKDEAVEQKVVEKKKKVENSRLDKKHTTREVTLENTTLPELNYSAKRITKYFKDQRPYSGDGLFVDPEFPPEARSIFGKDANGNYIDPNTERQEEALADFQFGEDAIVWRRPSELFGEDYAVFEGKIEFDDVRQGSIGNCYFMASISALTECPQIIAEIFRNHDVQKNGCYEIVLKIDGEWQVVVLDDSIPCDANSGKPMFANPKGKELWAILLEKAWAKVNGGYALTVAGMASEVIECLTNFPYEYNMINNETDGDDKKETLWAKIIEASGNEFIMTTALPPKEGAEELGLVEGHEYTLEEGKEEEINGDKVRLCLIRNPWGSIDYKGPWGKNDDRWTEEAKEKFNYDKVYDGEGEFYVPYELFRDFFADVDICKISSNICLKQVKLTYEECSHPSIYELHVHKPSQVDLTLFKPYYRFNKQLPSDWFMTQHIFVGKCEDENEMTFSKFYGKVEGQNDCSLSQFLEQGTYFIVVWANMKAAKDYDGPIDQDVLKDTTAVFSAYASEFIDLHYKGIDDKMSVFSRMALSYVRQNQDLCNEENNLLIYRGNNWEKSEFYFYYYKNLLDQSLNFKLTDNCRGLKTVTDQFEFVLRPQQEFIFIAACPDIYSGHCLNTGYGYEGTSDEGVDSLLPELIELADCPNDHKNLDLYKWMYKKNDINYSDILKEVKVNDHAFNHFKFKYPKEVEEILLIAKVEGQENKKLQVLDKIDLGDGDWYLGESLDAEQIQMYGRGMCKLGENVYVGQFVDHSFTGSGYMKFPDGSKLNGKFVDFSPVGTGTLTKNDGKVVKTQDGQVV